MREPREIKFRAWDPVEKQMIYNLNSATMYHGFLVPLADTILLQWTGLKDKNEKEIFKGDLLKIGECIYVVKFGDFDIENDSSFTTCRGWYLETADGEICALSEMTVTARETVVVENIYENQELFEKEKLLYSFTEFEEKFVKPWAAKYARQLGDLIENRICKEIEIKDKV
jgi:hypothetical protein